MHHQEIAGLPIDLKVVKEEVRTGFFRAAIATRVGADASVFHGISVSEIS